MAPEILGNALLLEGLRSEFRDTYLNIRNSQSDGRLAKVMDLGLTHDNRYGNYGYLNAAPHPTRWDRGATMPTDAMDSVQYEFEVWDWARRIAWHKHDRADDKTQSFLEGARRVGENFGLIPERIFFSLLLNVTTDLMPAVPTAPDGQAMFSTTSDGGSADRFGVTSGNLLTGGGILTVHDVRNDYYAALEQFGLFQDGKGQPLYSPEIIQSGVIILHAVADTEIMETTFLQQRQAVGLDNTGAVGGTVVDTSATSNLFKDASRNIELWASARLATLDWFVFLKNPPKLATGYITRQPVMEFTSLEGDNNSDGNRDKGTEYIQWEERSTGTISNPTQCIMINN